MLLATLRAALATCIVAASAIGAHAVGGGTIAWTPASILVVTAVSLPLIAASVASGPWQVAAYMVLAQAAAHIVLSAGHPGSAAVGGNTHTGMTHTGMTHTGMTLNTVTMYLTHAAAAALTAALLTAASRWVHQVRAAQSQRPGLPAWVLWLTGPHLELGPVATPQACPKPRSRRVIPAVEWVVRNQFTRRGPPCALPG